MYNVQFFHLQKGTTVLFIAVGANALPMVKKLIAKGALVNARRVGRLLYMVINSFMYYMLIGFDN